VKKRSTFVTVSIIAAIGIWSAMIPEEKVLITEKEPHFVDAYIRDFTMTAMNEDGKPDYTLKAELMEHYNDTGNSDIKQPVFNFIQEDGSWLVSAKRGNIDQTSTWVVLKEDVVMLQQDAENPVRIRTSQLRFNTKTQIADTDKPVDIDQGNSVLKSNGMIFNNTTGKLELLAGVNGTYVAP
jgi:LPS export ABC transporter protein LptC